VPDEPEITIPLIVDYVKTDIAFPMTRMIYFYLDGEESLSPWSLGLQNINFPFGMLSLSGIIFEPGNGQTVFSNWRQISDPFCVDRGRRGQKSECRDNGRIST
jgi:hypothetical protein